MNAVSDSFTVQGLSYMEYHPHSLFVGHGGMHNSHSVVIFQIAVNCIQQVPHVVPLSGAGGMVDIDLKHLHGNRIIRKVCEFVE